ncbi:MAG: DUF5642 family protein [Mycobacteriaceae bacterium]
MAYTIPKNWTKPIHITFHAVPLRTFFSRAVIASILSVEVRTVFLASCSSSDKSQPSSNIRISRIQDMESQVPDGYQFGSTERTLVTQESLPQLQQTAALTVMLPAECNDPMRPSRITPIGTIIEQVAFEGGGQTILIQGYEIPSNLPAHEPQIDCTSGTFTQEGARGLNAPDDAPVVSNIQMKGMHKTTYYDDGTQDDQYSYISWIDYRHALITVVGSTPSEDTQRHFVDPRTVRELFVKAIELVRT